MRISTSYIERQNLTMRRIGSHDPGVRPLRRLRGLVTSPERRHLPFAESAKGRGIEDHTARFTVTFLRWVKLSSMPSSENSRPMPLCL